MNTNPTPTKSSYTLLQTRLEEARMQLIQQGITLAALKTELEQLWLPCSFYGRTIDFDHLSHSDIIKVIKVFGGKWNKRPGFSDASIHYETVYKGFEIRCYSGQPPPNCKVEEYEEEIPERIEPARIVKRKRLVCIGEPKTLES